MQSVIRIYHRGPVQFVRNDYTEQTKIFTDRATAEIYARLSFKPHGYAFLVDNHRNDH